MSKGVDLIYGKPRREMFRFALPMILGNLFQQFYNMADSVIVGNFVGEDALAAVGASYSFTTVFIMVAIGGGIGSSVLVSQYFGAQKYDKMRTAINTFQITFVVFSVLLAIIGFAVNPFVLKLLETPVNIYEQAILYLQIYFVGLPFMFMYNVLSASFNALGKSKVPLYLLIFSSVLNIGLDLLFVVGFEWGVAGVAVATVMAQAVSSILSFVIFRIYIRRFIAEEKILLFDGSMFRKGVTFAIPSIVQQSIVSIGILLTQSAVNQFGSSAVAGYSAGNRLESIFIVPMVAMGNVMSTFTAQNVGAGKRERVREGYHVVLRMVLGFAILTVIVTQAFGRELVGFFVNVAESVEAYELGIGYIQYIGWFFVILGLKTTTDGILKGAGDVKVYMIANLVNLVIRVSVARLGAPIYGPQIVWYVEPVGWFVNFVISYAWYRKWKCHPTYFIR